jgi:hypothetical protein
MAIFDEIEALERKAQIAARDGNRLEAVIIGGDIRERTAKGRELLSRALRGDYTPEPITP